MTKRKTEAEIVEWRISAYKNYEEMSINLLHLVCSHKATILPHIQSVPKGDYRKKTSKAEAAVVQRALDLMIKARSDMVAAFNKMPVSPCHPRTVVFIVERASYSECLSSVCCGLSGITYDSILYGYSKEASTAAIKRDMENLNALFSSEYLEELEAKIACEVRNAQASYIKTLFSPVGNPIPKRECEASMDCRSVKWYGRLFTFTENQSRIINRLWSAWLEGTPEISIIEATEGITTSDRPRLMHLFRNSPALNAMVGRGKSRGSIRLIDRPEWTSGQNPSTP